MTVICSWFRNQLFIFCMNIRSNILLISKACYDLFFSKLSFLFMFNHDSVIIMRITSNESRSTQFIQAQILIQIIKKKHKFLKENFYLISNLFCNLLMILDVLVSVKIIINIKISTMRLHDQFELSVHFQKNQFSSALSLYSTSIQKSHLRQRSKKKVIIWAAETKIVSLNQEIIMSITHWKLKNEDIWFLNSI